MNKEIEKAVLRITQAMEKNRKAYDEARGSYGDTGYDRYWNKMNKLDAEYEEFKAFLHQEERAEECPGSLRKLSELQQKVKCIKSKWESLRYDLPVTADTIGIDDIFKDIKCLLN